MMNNLRTTLAVAMVAMSISTESKADIVLRSDLVMNQVSAYVMNGAFDQYGPYPDYETVLLDDVAIPAIDGSWSVACQNPALPDPNPRAYSTLEIETLLTPNAYRIDYRSNSYARGVGVRYNGAYSSGYMQGSGSLAFDVIGQTKLNVYLDTTDLSSNSFDAQFHIYDVSTANRELFAVGWLGDFPQPLTEVVLPEGEYEISILGIEGISATGGGEFMHYMNLSFEFEGAVVPELSSVTLAGFVTVAGGLLVLRRVRRVRHVRV